MITTIHTIGICNCCRKEPARVELKPMQWILCSECVRELRMRLGEWIYDQQTIHTAPEALCPNIP